MKEGEEVITLYKHLKSVERQTGKTPEQLKLPEIDEYTAYLWGLYNKVKYGCDVVNHESIFHYSYISRHHFNEFEIDCLLKVERARKEVSNGRYSKSSN